MPIKQIKSQHDLSLKHGEWLTSNYKNAEHKLIELENVFASFEKTLNNFDNDHGFANSRARLRMTTLYQVATANSGIVVLAKVLAPASISLWTCTDVCCDTL